MGEMRIIPSFLFLIIASLTFFSNSFAEIGGYPDPKFEICDEEKKDLIKNAHKKVIDIVNNSSCMSDDLRDKLKKKLNGGITFKCVTWFCKNLCGRETVPVLGSTIGLCPGAFNPDVCGCLEAVELHELIHKGGGYRDEDKPQACELSCFPQCAKAEKNPDGSPKYPPCDCK